MKLHKITALSLSICILLILLAVFSQVPSAKAVDKPTGELRIAWPTLFTETFHPFWAPNSRKLYYEPIYDFLIGINEEGKPDPKESIAFKWEESSDHLSWTFYIRDGVKFHDGTPVTIEDVKYSLDTIVQDEKNVCSRSIALPYQDRVETIPPNKVVVRLKRAWPAILNFVSPGGQGGGVILPKKYLEKVGQGFESSPIGSGPYKFLEKKEGNYIKFVAQDHHWRIGTPKYKYLTFKLIPEETTRVAALRAGEVDIALVGISGAEKLEGAGLPVVKKSGGVEMVFEFLRTYMPDNPLYKKEVRQALVYAIDKAAILKSILKGKGKLVGHTVAMFSWSLSYKDYPLTPYDPKKAKQLLAEAGYPNGFTIYYYNFATSIPEQKLVGEAIASYWEAIGMNVKIVELDASAYFPIWMKKKEPLGPAAHTHSWASRRIETWRPLYHSDVNRFYFSQTSDPELDRLIEEFDNQIILEGMIQAERKCMDRVLANFYKTNILSCDILLGANKEVPEWNSGKGLDNFRFEYIGATK